eukprot:Nk52_evm31s248 gene=Nk52_evmTU31s248
MSMSLVKSLSGFMGVGSSRVVGKTVISKCTRMGPMWNRCYSAKTLTTEEFALLGFDEKVQHVEDKLTERFNPKNIKIVDHSPREVGVGCGLSYSVFIVSPEFKGLSRVRQHQLVQKELTEELKHIHAFRVNTYSGEGPTPFDEES